MSLREPIDAPAARRVPLKGGVELGGHWLFAEPPYSTDRYGVKIYGNDFTGAPCMVADLRGWGYLTGHGTALGMPAEQAIEAQKAMATFICDAMNKAMPEGQPLPWRDQLERHILREMTQGTMSLAPTETFRGLAAFAHSGVTREMARAMLRDMTERGLCHYCAGLFNDDGEPRGAGYGPTAAGLARLEELGAAA